MTLRNPGSQTTAPPSEHPGNTAGGGGESWLSQTCQQLRGLDLPGRTTYWTNEAPLTPPPSAPDKGSEF